MAAAWTGRADSSQPVWAGLAPAHQELPRRRAYARPQGGRGPSSTLGTLSRPSLISVARFSSQPATDADAV